MRGFAVICVASLIIALLDGSVAVLHAGDRSASYFPPKMGLNKDEGPMLPYGAIAGRRNRVIELRLVVPAPQPQPTGIFGIEDAMLETVRLVYEEFSDTILIYRKEWRRVP